MANKMLIDATHPEETRVVVLRGNRVEEFDFESAHRKQLRGNIYLAKVTRVEPSLQAAFVDYGGNRHGFLAFSEIHPDYYQIPIADRQALIAEEERAQRAAVDDMERVPRRVREAAPSRRDDDVIRSEAAEPLAGDIIEPDQSEPEPAGVEESSQYSEVELPEVELPTGAPAEDTTPSFEPAAPIEPGASADQVEAGVAHEQGSDEPGSEEDRDAIAEAEITSSGPAGENGESTRTTEARALDGSSEEDEAAEEVVESVGGADALEEVPDRAPRFRRQYKIQEVIKRRQVMLVQVVKEERGTKGAALTTYLSLAGRYSVLMPNTARGGGISRKITSPDDRARLREAAAELEVPEGMGVILRTAGASRTKIEIKRDFEYLLRMWETVRDLTLKSTAPKLVYEEGSLVKRSLRDLYSKDVDEVLVAGADAYHEAKDFMRMLMPSHAKNVKLYADSQPLLSRYGVENQLDAMFSPVVQLRSGGYVVLNQAEALVAIDVNSGRATREHHIEDTAFKTNLEAADEIARQLRLRDLAGLIVIDFIDMDEKRNNRAVERRLKECLKHDRARIQVGRISHFGLLEMSRQRIRTSVLESSTEKCPYCGGSGHVRSVSSLALQVLRALEDQLIRGATHTLIARTRPDVALYVLNQKRAHLRALEDRFAITVTITADETVRAPQTFVIDRGEQVHTPEAAKAIAERAQAPVAPLEEEDDLEEIGGEVNEAEQAESEAEMGSHAVAEPGEGGSRRRRRRRRRGRGGGDHAHDHGHHHAQPDVEQIAITSAHHSVDDRLEYQAAAAHNATPDEAQDEGMVETMVETTSGFATEPNEGHEGPRRDDRRRRRGRRGGRRNRQRGGEGGHLGGHSGGHAGPNQSEPYTQGDFAPAEQLTAPAPTEPELSHAVADLDSPPRERAIPPDVLPPDVSAPNASPPIPPATIAQPEAARRRSTVREPAAMTGGEAGGNDPGAPAASQGSEPVITQTGETSEGERPRRTGWWSRRFAGG
jgi:ribonuclease E